MKCDNCGFENNDKAKFCTKCGKPLKNSDSGSPQGNSNSKLTITVLIAVIILLVGGIGYYAITTHYNPFASHDNYQEDVKSDSNGVDSSDDSNAQTSESKAQATESKSWESIGHYSGSGSGSKSIKVPAGKIKVKLSAYPIKNYATNHLYVSGSNGQSGGVDWGSHSDVETRSDTFTFESSSPVNFNIDYYETVSWDVEFFRYQ